MRMTMQPGARLSAVAKWISLISPWSLIGIAGLAVLRVLFGFYGFGLLRVIFLAVPLLLATLPLFALRFLKAHPRYYPASAIVAILIWGTIPYSALMQHNRAYRAMHPTLQQPFEFSYFDSLPEKSRLSGAEAQVRSLFPPGSRADDFEAYFVKSGAKCFRRTDNKGRYIVCMWATWPFPYLVETDWILVAYLDPALPILREISINRNLTGS